MSALNVTFRRTFAYSRNMLSNAVIKLVFLVVSATIFSFELESAENTQRTLAEVWATSIAPLLPIFASLLAMDSWSEERRTRRIESLMSIAVRERDLVIGKFLGVYIEFVITVVLACIFALIAIVAYVPTPQVGATFVAFAPALVALSLQGALWCSASMLISSLFTNLAAAACVSVALLFALPRGVYFAFVHFSLAGRTAFGEMPLDAWVADFASGTTSLDSVVGYCVFTITALFVATKLISRLRFVGRGSRNRRYSTYLVILLSMIAALSVVLLVRRAEIVIEAPFSDTSIASPRLVNLLSESSGNMTATCFLPRNDARFRHVGKHLRSLKRSADIAGGLHISLKFVDPNWDVGAAERLVRLGVTSDAIVFEKGRRIAVVALAEGYDDRVIASALQRVVMSPKRRDIYWTLGHGEIPFDDYGAWGMSDVARELSREGYRNLTIDLAQHESIPADCALIIVAGARNGFSRMELGRIDAYLRGGGRVLVLARQSVEDGIASLLPSWGIRPIILPLTTTRTLSGSDVIVSDFADHAISSTLVGQRIVMERPLIFESSAVADGAGGADKIEFSSLAKVGGKTVIAAIERGVGARSDIAVRPTRMVIFGDSTFVMNGQLASRANANLDLFLNAIAYLSGTDAPSASGVESGLLVTGMDRVERLNFTLLLAVVLPLVAFIVMMFSLARRHRQ